MHWVELLTPLARGSERRMSRRVWQLGRSSNSLRECFDSALVKCVLHGRGVEKQVILGRNLAKQHMLKWALQVQKSPFNKKKMKTILVKWAVDKAGY